jgi:putative oxidoreductase
MSNPSLQRVMATEAEYGPLALRAIVGVIFVAHGAQKLFGWFGGYGLDGTGQFLASVGLKPGYLLISSSVMTRMAEFVSL